MHPEPVATYRLQLRPGFGFEHVLGIIEYLAELGISHLYTSPYLQAAADSTHGYDVVDPSKINIQIGNEESHQVLCEKIKSSGLGLMIDVVPNHMAIVGKQNPWWWDVLENGPSSIYATYFDVDWDSSEERWPNKVLLPLLGDHYGRVLENGELKLSYQDGYLVLHYHENTFPIDPSSHAGFLNRVAESCHSELLAFLAESFARLPRPSVTSRKAVERRHRDKEVLYHLLVRSCLEEPDSNAAIKAEIERLNRNPDALDDLIQQQNYRLSFWKTANIDLGYRRFFDIKDLVGVRMEDYDAFCAIHQLPIKWFKNGCVQGLRIDHPDGLRNPKEYFLRLQEACPNAWVVAEKILEPREKLPKNWKVSGTTGYDFLNLTNSLLVDSKGKQGLTKLYTQIVGSAIDFKQLVYECKLLVLNKLFGSEMNQLTNLFIAVCEKHRRHRDYTRPELCKALCQTAACFPVYRSYVSASNGQVSEDDQHYVNEAITLATKACPDLDQELFHFLKDILLLKISGKLENELAMRFQQLTGPAMAKGFEDTALYRYNRFVSLNEVGGDPSCFGITPKQFHEACLAAQKEHPYSLLASTTHDTKRSEDVRARLALLSEIPEKWGQAVFHWIDMNKRYQSGELPDPNTLYLFYQTLVGAWPLSQERATAYMEKAIREAKQFTSWTQPNKEYEESVRNYIVKVLEDTNFRSHFESFLTPLIYPGRINSLSQTLLKLTAPGIPDIYQGCSCWNFSLVDPDNRQLVDFASHKQLLEEAKSLSIEEILARMDEGMPKLWMTYQVLHLRKKWPKLFSEGSYQPLYAEGQKNQHVVAFIRAESFITIIPRLPIGLKNDWQDTVLALPSGTWIDIFTREQFKGEKTSVSTLLKLFPVALLAKEEHYG